MNVRRPNLVSSFKSPHSREFRALEMHWFYKYNHLITNFNLLLVLLAVLFLFSFSNSTALVLLVSLLVFTSIQYLVTWKKANSLVVRRSSINNSKIENQEITFDYEILNLSSFFSAELRLQEHYPFNVNSQTQKNISMGPKRKLRTTMGAKADAGMGVFSMNPVSLEICDPFGLFVFRAEKACDTQVQVFPEPMQIDEIESVTPQNNFDLGAREVPRPGFSINFSGVRPYRWGDPIRHMAWKLSAKNEELYIKEFEKSVSQKLSLVLNLDPQCHITTKRHSSFEFVKDVCMAMAEQKHHSGNSMAFFSRGAEITSGSGDGLLIELSNYLTRRLVFDESELRNLNWENQHSRDLESHSDPLLHAIWQTIDPESHLIYVGPLDARSLLDNKVFFESHKHQGGEVSLFLTDLSPFEHELRKHKSSITSSDLSHSYHVLEEFYKKSINVNIVHPEDYQKALSTKHIGWQGGER